MATTSLPKAEQAPVLMAAGRGQRANPPVEGVAKPVDVGGARPTLLGTIRRRTGTPRSVQVRPSGV